MPVRKTRKHRKSNRRSSRHSSRRCQRGGGDDCGIVGKMRLPGYDDCKYWYDPITRSVLSALYPTEINDIATRELANEILYRLLATIHTWRINKIKKGGKPSVLDGQIMKQFEKQGWPKNIKKVVEYYIEVMESDDYEIQGDLMELIEEFNGTRPSYAPLLSPTSSVVLDYTDPDAFQTPPASADTKEKLLAWIAEAKYPDIHDPITQEKWSDMTKEELQRIVRTEEGRVYTVESLESIFRDAMKANTPAKNAMRRISLTSKNAGALRKVMRQTNPAYELPSHLQQGPPENMGFIVVETDDENFYKLSIIDIREGTTLFDLGFIPANIDESISGSTGVTSAVALATLQRAWESGKFLSSYRHRFHLGKTREYWTSPGSTPAGRLAAFIKEVESILR